MNKKAEGFVALFIGITIIVLLVAYFAIPIVRQSTAPVSGADTYTKTLTSANETFTLTNTPVVDNTLVVSGLVADTNYTVDYDTATVTFLADVSTNASAYTLNYDYTLSQYLDNTMERGLFALVILALIVGVIFFILNGFGMND
jgi:O-antigen ligase